MVSIVGLARLVLAYENLGFGKRKDDWTQEKKPLILEWPHSDLWYGSATVLQSFTKGKAYQWNLEIDPSLRELGCVGKSKPIRKSQNV